MNGQRFPWTTAYGVAGQIVRVLRPSCVRITIAGSLRREKASVGDIEILYIPILSVHPDPDDLFQNGTSTNLADEEIARLEANRILGRRLNAKGQTTFGEKNKLMIHIQSLIPVDLFSATEANWFNYLVCRTGPAELNARIATEAQRIGWKWNPYGPGFTRPDGEMHPVLIERDVFDFVSLTYREPAQRA